MKAPPKELLLGASEAYVEYARDGTVIKGAEPAIPKSRYEEDVYINNHTSVWGSYYDIPNRAWGFACCKQTMKNSWCTAIGQKEEEPEPVGKARTAVPSPPAAKAASPAKESALAGVQLGTVPAEEGGAYTRIEQSIDKSSKKSKKKSGDDDDDMVCCCCWFYLHHTHHYDALAPAYFAAAASSLCFFVGCRRH